MNAVRPSASAVPITVYILCLGLVITGMAPLALATDTPQQRGTALANACATCHGPEGRSKGAIPPLAAKDDQALRDSLRGFRDGTRTGTVMNRLMQGLNDDDIAALAAYFARQARPQGQR